VDNDGGAAMKITSQVQTEKVTDVTCDVCQCSTRLDNGGLQYGTLQAYWGYGATHDGEHYELHLCEGCFFQTIAFIKQERRGQTLFSEDTHTQAVADETLGLISKDDYFNDSGKR
jgi:hypothetical protein